MGRYARVRDRGYEPFTLGCVNKRVKYIDENKVKSEEESIKEDWNKVLGDFKISVKDK